MDTQLNSTSLNGSAMPALAVSAATEAKPAQRILAFDFTKGILVLFMVLYHWLNYFVGPQGDFYKYLRFLTPSFIFITGFLISHVHFRKYGTGSLQLSKRLLVRGSKLLVVFVLTNLLMGLLIPNSSVRRIFSEGPLADNLYAVFVSGNVAIAGIGKTASFIILIPIAYLLIVSAGLSALCRFSRYVFPFSFAISLLCVVVLDELGIHSMNVELLMMGLLGVVCGFATGEMVANLPHYAYALCSVYVAYLAAITVWNVPLALRVFGVVLTTALIYIAGIGKRDLATLRSRTILLGQYSLFGYLSQIAILRILRRLFFATSFASVTLPLSLVLALTLTIGLVEVLDRARAKVRPVDALYRAIFA